MTTRGRQGIPARAASIDSSAFYALASSRDANHPTARVIAAHLDAGGWRLVITNFLRAEANALILNRAGHRAANRFLAELHETTGIELIRVTAADEVQALALIARYEDKDFSLTDAISFVIMERLQITHAFSFDDDFHQYGFISLSRENLPD